MRESDARLIKEIAEREFISTSDLLRQIVTIWLECHKKLEPFEVFNETKD